MRVFKIALLVFSSILVFQACREETKTVVKTEPVTFKKEGILKIIKNKAGTVITVMDIEIAESEYETQTGLMYRQSMEDTQGMLFIFPDERMHSFYMKNTEIPLDIIFIKADSTIASVQENARPYDESGLSSKVPVRFVLEVNAGLAKKWSLEVGDKIDFKKL
ncbi:MAG: DUF192 domain-containing protein [Flavobacteriaceae bacterium]